MFKNKEIVEAHIWSEWTQAVYIGSLDDVHIVHIDGYIYRVQKHEIRKPVPRNKDGHSIKDLIDFFQEGGAVQVLWNNGDWVTKDYFRWDCDVNNYRLKPEDETCNKCMQKLNKFEAENKKIKQVLRELIQ